MRLIFGSQLELLDELNAKQPQGESIDALKKHYDSAVQKYGEMYQDFPYDQYLAFLEHQGLVPRTGNRLSITPEEKALLAYRVWIGDTLPKAL